VELVAVRTTRIRRELGDADQIRSERDGIENAIKDLRCGYDRVRDVLVDRVLERRPDWLTTAPGGRPGESRERETWDKGVRSGVGLVR
jgi:hypothetical protein